MPPSNSERQKDRRQYEFAFGAEVAFKLVTDKKRSGILLPEVLETEYESDSVVVKENESKSLRDTDEILNKPIAVE